MCACVFDCARVFTCVFVGVGGVGDGVDGVGGGDCGRGESREEMRAKWDYRLPSYEIFLQK